MSVQSSSASGAVPSGWSVDHESPDQFVVRCTQCGRVSIKDDRGRAHRLADNHAIRCSPTGVTPVSRPDGPGGDREPEPDAAVTVTGFDAFEHDLVGEEIVVRYDSIDPSSDGIQVAGDVVDMVSAPDADVEFRGLVLRLPTGVRRRLDLVDGTIGCEHNSTPGWRTIGELTSIAPTTTKNAEAVAMTDGAGTSTTGAN